MYIDIYIAKKERNVLLTPILNATFIYLTSYTCGQVHEDEYGFHVPTAVAVKSPVLGWVMVAFSLSPHPHTQLIGRVSNGVD